MTAHRPVRPPAAELDVALLADLHRHRAGRTTTELAEHAHCTPEDALRHLHRLHREKLVRPILAQETRWTAH